LLTPIWWVRNTILAIDGATALVNESKPMKGKYKNYLAECLDRSKIRAPDLARMAKTAPQNVNRFLNGERELTKQWAELFAEHMPGIDPADLIFGPDRAGARRNTTNEGGVPGPEGGLSNSEVVSADTLLAIIQETVDLATSVLAPEGIGARERDALIRQALRAQLDRLALAPPQGPSRSAKAGPSSAQARVSSHRVSSGDDQQS
jgi:hypothetical protein